MVAFGFLAALPAIGSALGSIFGGAAKGASSSRESANNQALLQDRNRTDQFGIQQNAATSAANAQQQAIMQALLGGSNEQNAHANIDLDRRKFVLDAPSTRGKQALLGSLMQNMKPVTMTGGSPQMLARMPQFSGGLSPSALGPLARQMGLLMQQNSVAGQQKGDTFAPLERTDFKSGVLDPGRSTVLPPILAQLQKAGLLEKILGGIGLGGSLLGGLGGLTKGSSGGGYNSNESGGY